jgi:predicted restriction endonuclease
MGLREITAESVRGALEDYDRLGVAVFRSDHGFTSVPPVVLVHGGRTYDAYAILGVAHGKVTGTSWQANDFPAGIAPVLETLDRLGYESIDLRGQGKRSEKARYGEIPERPVGATFPNRTELQRAGVHRPGQAGICGTRKFGAESIVVSGGYADDEDIGDVIIYTGHGGQDERKQQVEDQTFEDSGNAALLKSSFTGTPVRVIRGAHAGSSFAPPSGFRYDGLYRVVDAWMETGQHGYRVCRYTLTQVGSDTTENLEAPTETVVLPVGTEQPGRSRSVVQRVVRSTRVSQSVKRLYGDTCQACATRLDLPGGRSYSEGAHIRPISGGHKGPDTPSNILCLCPNCHVLFDKGALIIDVDMKVRVNGTATRVLAVDANHRIGEKFLRYHRDRFATEA